MFTVIFVHLDVVIRQGDVERFHDVTYQQPGSPTTTLPSANSLFIFMCIDLTGKHGLADRWCCIEWENQFLT